MELIYICNILADKRSSVKHTVPVRATSSSGEHGIRVDADRGSGPSRGQKRRSSTQTLYSLLRHEASDESTTQRHIKRFRIQQEIANNNNNNNPLASKEAALRLPRAGADHNKKATTSEHEGAHHRRVFDKVLNTIGDGGEFKCGQCMTTFTQRSLLNNHLCSRMPCKPYRCGHCQEAFGQPKELRMHAVVHVSEKPFKCGYCLRAFSGATTLNNHVRTHTGEKPFLCEGCGKSFSQAFQLSRHRRICLQHAD